MQSLPNRPTLPQRLRLSGEEDRPAGGARAACDARQAAQDAYQQLPPERVHRQGLEAQRRMEDLTRSRRSSAAFPAVATCCLNAPPPDRSRLRAIGSGGCGADQVGVEAASRFRASPLDST